MPEVNSTVGVLLSGGLDSAILTAWLLEQGCSVRPFYVRCGLAWEPLELPAARRFLAAVSSPRLRELVALEMPSSDLYHDHWSVTGHGTPSAECPDEAVYMPGRNPLLLVKAAIWCQLHGIRQLALAALGTSPFADASAEFFDSFQTALSRAGGQPLEIIRPFAQWNKWQVMQLGRQYPLELSFSCIAPQGLLHCGRCNKCAERKAAFDAVGLDDPTPYANQQQASASELFDEPARDLGDSTALAGRGPLSRME